MADRSETFTYKIKADTDAAERDVEKLDKEVEQLTDKPKTLAVKADTSSLSGFAQSVRTNMASAEGAMGKVKAAGSTMLSGLSQAGPLALAGAATAIGAFAVKAVGHFVDVSKAAIDFGAATGLAVEDASRWIAVADDFGVGADQLASAFGKVSKSLDSEKWREYGIATRDAAGNARDANDIIADALGYLSSISNETERARVGQDLFGKSFANLAPLLGKTSDEYKDYLAAVEDGQVITEQEAGKAERMRLAQDALADATDEVTLALGSMVAEMAPAIEQAAALVTELSKLGDVKLPFQPGDTNLMTGQITYAQMAWKGLRDEFDKVSNLEGDGKKLGQVFADIAANSDDAASASGTFLESLTGGTDAMIAFKTAADEASAAQAAFFESQRAAADSSYAAEQAADDLVASIVGYQQAVTEAGDDTAKLRDIQDDTRDSATKYADAQVRLAQETAKADGTTLSAADSQRTWLASMIDAAAYMEGPQKAAIIDYISRVTGIPPEKVTDILADPDEDSVAKASSMIDTAAKDRDSTINVDADTSEARAKFEALRRFASNPINVIFNGRPVLGSVAVPPSSASPTPTGAPRATSPRQSSGGTITNNITLNTRATSGREVTRELDRWARLNGRRGQ